MFHRTHFYSGSISRIAALALAFGLVACSQSENTSAPSERLNQQEVFSDRSVGLSTEILMIQLSQPALLETEMTEEDIQAVKLEQENFERKLKGLSGQIQVLYRYRFTLNGMAVVTPNRLINRIKELVEVKTTEGANKFDRPLLKTAPIALTPAQDKVTSVSFLGVDALHQQGITGKGVHVGVIDTGIDYTHRMLGGSGKPEDYKSIDPTLETPLFPNEKVVGGIDLAGSRFSGQSDVYDDKVPQPDSNPLDEAGHGTHVAGTVAGIGDDENTYSGMAPDAKLHAIKVFGKTGGTFDAMVIAGFEYAMDPNNDMDTADRLDVLNLSLGGEFGTQKILYSRAIQNLSRSGMVIVAAAGNSGDVQSVVGAPGTSEEALSVAASVDARELNWRFSTVKFTLSSGKELVTEYAEGPITIPLKEVESLSGELVHLGLADQDLSDEVKAKLNGKIALIGRGVVPFMDKLRRAKEAGALGVIVYNNEAGSPIPMGSDKEGDKVEIPGVMVSKDIGDEVVAALSSGPVVVDFKNADVIDKPELIDTITDFSSRGPRTEDYGFKPEVSAPGKQILSAEMGSGVKGALNDGTSMASPHVAGAVALLKQKNPELSGNDFKGLLMNSAKPLSADGKAAYRYSTQGAGRIQLVEASQAEFIATSSYSFGLVEVPLKAPLARVLKLKNISQKTLILRLAFSGEEMSLNFPTTVTLLASAEKEIDLSLSVQTGTWNAAARTKELNGQLEISSQNSKTVVPFMVYRTQKSQILGSSLNVTDKKVGKSEDLHATAVLKNQSEFPGAALLFNLIETDEKKLIQPGQEWRSDACDLQSVGYRWTVKQGPTGQVPHLQFAFQLFEPRNQLKYCDFSILVDVDGDGSPDQEIVGISDRSIFGFQGQPFFAAILDYKKAREIRAQYELAGLMGVRSVPDFRPAAIAVGQLYFATDTGLTIFDVPAKSIGTDKDSNFKAKISAINNLGDAIEVDDYLGSDESTWRTLTTNRFNMGYWGMSDVEIPGLSEVETSLIKSKGQSDLVIYSPTNIKEMEMVKVE